jgi:hypothetical protein
LMGGSGADASPPSGIAPVSAPPEASAIRETETGWGWGVRGVAVDGVCGREEGGELGRWCPPSVSRQNGLGGAGDMRECAGAGEYWKGMQWGGSTVVVVVWWCGGHGLRGDCRWAA